MENNDRTVPYYQIGWSDSHKRDIRLEVDGSMSAPIFRLIRYLPDGQTSYINMMAGEAVRLYNALGQAMNTQQQCTKHYRQPDKTKWDEPEDDPLGSD